jgi:Undecaprenyl-phosphate glucose phosphotransferase
VKLKYKVYYIFSLLFFDLSAIFLVYFLTIKFVSSIVNFDLSNDYKSLLFVYIIFWMGASGFNSLYSINKSIYIDKIHIATWVTFILQQIFFVLYLYFDTNTALTKLFLVVQFTGLLFLILLIRFIYTILYFKIIKSKDISKQVSIIGNSLSGIKLAQYFESKPLEYQFAGFIDKDIKDINEENISYYFKKSLNNGINNIYLITNNSLKLSINELFNISENFGIKLKLVNHLNDSYFNNLKTFIDQDFQFFNYRKENLEYLSERLKKRVFDIFFSLFVIIFILSWLSPIIAIIIKLQSKGPVIFKQLRNGRNNKVFYCFKFRSLKNYNENTSKQVTKNDSRLTKIGSFMRKTNIDELPQFINVLLGDMSVVGPRPHMIEHNKLYNSLISKYLVRNFVKPGITGWAQVNGFRGETKEVIQMEKRIQKDIEYIEDWSLMFDLRIIFLTIYSTIKGDENAI